MWQGQVGSPCGNGKIGGVLARGPERKEGTQGSLGATETVPSGTAGRVKGRERMGGPAQTKCRAHRQNRQLGRTGGGHVQERMPSVVESVKAGLLSIPRSQNSE